MLLKKTFEIRSRDGDQLAYGKARTFSDFLRPRLIKNSRLLRNAHFNDCLISGLDLRDVYFSKAQFVKTRFENCTFEFSTFNDALFKDVAFTKCHFLQCNFTNSIFLRTREDGIQFGRLQDSAFRKSIITSCCLRDAILEDVGFFSTCVSGSDFFPIGRRSDSHVFYIQRRKGSLFYIKAGCRYFSMEEAEQHWNSPHYENSEELRQESLNILKYAKTVAFDHSWNLN